jgi:hypothetical protein
MIPFDENPPAIGVPLSLVSAFQGHHEDSPIGVFFLAEPRLNPNEVIELRTVGEKERCIAESHTVQACTSKPVHASCSLFSFFESAMISNLANVEKSSDKVLGTSAPDLESTWFFYDRKNETG